jgi:hypothetical protein
LTIHADGARGEFVKIQRHHWTTEECYCELLQNEVQSGNGVESLPRRLLYAESGWNSKGDFHEKQVFTFIILLTFSSVSQI